MEGLGTPKTLKNQWFFKVFAVVRFRYFGALDGSWAHLGSSCGELVPKWLPKWVPRWLQIEPRWAILAITGHSPRKPELSSKLLFPRWPQDGSRRPRIAQDSLLGAFLGLQKLFWKALDPPKTFKNQWFDVRFAFDLRIANRKHMLHKQVIPPLAHMQACSNTRNAKVL